MNLEGLTTEITYDPQVRTLYKVMYKKPNHLPMIFVLGRNAYSDGVCVFDNPHQLGTSEYDHWLDGFIYEENKVRRGDV